MCINNEKYTKLYKKTIAIFLISFDRDRSTKKRVETENIASEPFVSLINKLTIRITSTAFIAS
jgi:hypothetical protein